MQWASDASAKFQEMLSDVPAMFRGMAKSMAASAAEKAATERGATEVSFEDMVRGFIQATPGHMREDLKKLFAGHGVEIQNYRADFER